MNDIDREAAIVLAVGAAGVSAGTVEFVAAQAADLDLDVQLVHVVPTHVGDTTLGIRDVGITFDVMAESGQRTLDQAARMVRERLGSTRPVSAELLRGGVIPTLVDHSHLAQMMVLQSNETGRWDRLVNGSTIASVAATAHSPVVAVPAAWTPRGALPITVPVDDAARGQAEVWTALGMATAHNLPVHVVRATYLPSIYEQLLLHDSTHHDLLLAARAELESDVDLPAGLWQQIPVSFDVTFGKAVDEIVKAGSHSSMLVLARRDPRYPFGSHLGPVVRHVLREATCPVMVVEPSLAAVVPVSADASSAVDRRRVAQAVG